MWRVPCEHNLATCFRLNEFGFHQFDRRFTTGVLNECGFRKCLLNVTSLHSWLKTSQSNLMASKCALNIYIFFWFLLTSRTSTSDFWRVTFCFSETFSDAERHALTRSELWQEDENIFLARLAVIQQLIVDIWYSKKFSVWWKWNISMTRVMLVQNQSGRWTIKSLDIILRQKRYNNNKIKSRSNWDTKMFCDISYK